MAKKAVRKKLMPVNRRLYTVRIIGIRGSSLIQHNWTQKAMQEMFDKQVGGKKTRDRTTRDPMQEGKEAGYYLENGNPGLLAVAVKAAIVEAAHNDLGIPRTLVQKSMFIYPPGRNALIPLETVSGKGTPEPEIVQDMVRLNGKSADLRWRPYYHEWAATPSFEVDGDLLQMDDFLKLVDRAGFGIGVNEWRPQKGGESGRFKIDVNHKVTDKPLKP